MNSLGHLYFIDLLSPQIANYELSNRVISAKLYIGDIVSVVIVLLYKLIFSQLTNIFADISYRCILFQGKV